ncbi:hypothetical protein C2S51_002215 [Perilla frutescens var. frutescens]|nr:hypothetical protein C2S51_002215 [Perilla frutescens var. frutescens]
MSSMLTHITLKKTYFYNFYPVKAEEETAAPTGFRYHRMLVEIRDVRAPPVLDPRQPWQIKKTLTHQEVTCGKVVVPFNDTFEYILRYWNFCMSNHIAILGHRVAVVVWDVTNERQPRKYEGNDVYFQITPSENYVLTCTALMRDRKLKVDDYIGLYWDPRQSFFRIKLFYSNI